MGSGSKETTTIIDNWKNMPPFMKEVLQDNSLFGQNLLQDAFEMGPREIEGMNDIETGAFDHFLTGAETATGKSDAAWSKLMGSTGSDALNYFNDASGYYNFGNRVDDLGQFDHGYTPGQFDGGYEAKTFDGGYDPRETKQTYDARTFDGGYDPVTFDSGYKGPQTFDGGYKPPTAFDGGYEATDFTGASGYDAEGNLIDNTYTGDRLTDMIGGKDFELDYTGNVVDTTLAGMDRKEQRDRLARQSQQAAVGGVSSTRSAVEDAIAGQLSGMNRAEMEAKLRDDAQRFGTDALFKQAGMLDTSDLNRGQMDMDASKFNEGMRQFAANMNIDEAKLSDMAKQFMSEQNLTEQDMTDLANRFGSTMQLDQQKAAQAASEFGAELNLNQQELQDAAMQFSSQQNLTEQELEDASAKMAQQFGITIDEVNDLRDQFASKQSLEEQSLGDSSSRFASDQTLKEQEMRDLAERFLSGQNLSQQEMEEASKQFGLGFDKSLMDTGLGAKEFGMNFDKGMADTMESMADSGLRRDMSIYDVIKSFGGEQRGLDQAGNDVNRDQLNWLAAILGGREQGNSLLPNNSTQTTSQPGNSALQNALGIGTSLAGAWMMSDERVKEDVSDPDESALDKLRKLSTGMQEYKYRPGYGHTTQRTSGLMAQDLEKAGIEGAVTEINGIKHVDPYPVLATVVQAVRELDMERRAG